MPANSRSVARPGRWGNPWPVTEDRTAAEAVKLFRQHVEAMSEDGRHQWLAPLRGMNLACWCKLDAPCHVDVLLEYANP
jgi:hypothetical protein